MNATTEEATSSDPVCAQKAFATVQARLALRGWALIRHAGGKSFWATKWGRSRELTDLNEVAAFASAVEAQP